MIHPLKLVWLCILAAILGGGCMSGRMASTLTDLPYTPPGKVRFRIDQVKMEGGDLASAQNYQDFYSSVNIGTLAIAKRPDVFSKDPTALPIVVDLSLSSNLELLGPSFAGYMLTMGALPSLSKVGQAVSVKVSVADPEFSALFTGTEQYGVLHTSAFSMLTPSGLIPFGKTLEGATKEKKFTGRPGHKDFMEFVKTECIQAIANSLSKADQPAVERLHAQWPELQKQRREQSLQRIEALKAK